MYFNKLLAFIVIYGLTVSQAASSGSPNDKKPWGLHEALNARQDIRRFGGTWLTDNAFYHTDKNQSIHVFNVYSSSDLIYNFSSYIKETYNSSSLEFSPDYSQILVRYDYEKISRHSFLAKYDVFDIETQKSIKIHRGKKLQNCAWSFVKGRLGYVHNNDVYIHFENDKEVQITNDGIDGVLFNGVPDSTYKEVFFSDSAIWWSEDGDYLAVGVFNDTDVETYKIFMYGAPNDLRYQYPKEINVRYPKSGRNIPTASVKVFKVDFQTENVSSYASIKAPVDVVSQENILQSVAWTSDSKLLITWLNRRQNISSLQVCDTAGKCREATRIEEPKGWVEIGRPICLKQTTNCLIPYWIGDWYQVWKLNLTTGQNVWGSRGNFTILEIYGYDEVNEILYYQATLESDPSIFHVFKNSECLTCNLTDVDGVKCLWAYATFSLYYSYYAVTCNGPSPSFTKIFETKNNTLVKDWEANTEFRAKLANKRRPRIEFRNVTLADGSIGMAKLQFPANLDETKKYPMILYVNNAASSVNINRRFFIEYAGYMVTNYNVIYATIDGRGTGNKGKELLFSVNNHLGEFEVEDQISVTKTLQKEFLFIDEDRCGIWGWGEGGYTATRILANDTDGVFKCGVAVAPVTSWLYAPAILTERYMGLPSENMEKYLSSSLLQQVENFKTHNFLLIHGSGDELVHYQHSLMLAKVLQQNGIIFEQMTYTDANYLLLPYWVHMFTIQDKFWNNCLNLTKIN